MLFVKMKTNDNFGDENFKESLRKAKIKAAKVKESVIITVFLVTEIRRKIIKDAQQGTKPRIKLIFKLNDEWSG